MAKEKGTHELRRSGYARVLALRTTGIGAAGGSTAQDPKMVPGGESAPSSHAM